MKCVMFLVISYSFQFAICNFVYCQAIPLGISTDSIPLYNPDEFYTNEPLNPFGPQNYELVYYKPTTYDSASPIWLHIHGTGGTGMEGPQYLSVIADRKKALIVAPTFSNNVGDSYVYGGIGYSPNFPNMCPTYSSWLPPIFRQIYRYILMRENRDSIPIFFSGFSAGGQCVTRYMLLRQGMPDSIPIVNAVSVSPFFYAFPTDTFLGVEMLYPCGTKHSTVSSKMDTITCLPNYIANNMCYFSTPRQVKSYYNENYIVAIGELDTATNNDAWTCRAIQGNGRLAKARNFYAFADSNAITRGTTLKWQYAEIPGAGHSTTQMFYTKADSADTSTILETLLFDTPYHPVPDFSPKANFTYLPATLIAQFYDNSQNSSNSWLWNFGDEQTSTEKNPLHTFGQGGTYYVCLTVGDSCISDTYCDSIIIQGTETGDVKRTDKILINPNPFSSHITLTSSSNISSVKIQNLLGQKIFQSENTTLKNNMVLNLSSLSGGIYFFIIDIDSQIQNFKIIKL